MHRICSIRLDTDETPSVSASTFISSFFLKRVYVALCHISGSRALFTRLINLFLYSFYIKNKFHDIIYSFKNYFTTVFLAK